MMPKRKPSDFDYILFDMPPVNQTNATVGFVGFIDKSCVVEAEKNNRELVKRGCRELFAVGADFALVP
jgi:Mrp family chromosome partitioning ATPase